MVAVLGIVSYGVWFTHDYVSRTHFGSGPTVPPTTTVTTDDEPSEKRVGTVSDSYTVAADRPRSLRISRLGIHAYIQPVGVTKDNAMATPSNIGFVGWYDRGAVPGTDGVSILNGHVSGRYADGVFKRLHELTAGDDIQVEMGNKTSRSFTVRSVRSYKTADAAGPLYQASGTSGRELHLITCGGTFDKASDTYRERLIVVAD